MCPSVASLFKEHPADAKGSLLRSFSDVLKDLSLVHAPGFAAASHFTMANASVTTTKRSGYSPRDDLRPSGQRHSTDRNFSN